VTRAALAILQKDLTIELRTRECADRNTSEIRMRVEVPGVSSERLSVVPARRAAGQKPEGGLDAEGDAVPEKRLIIPCSLHCE
jgi:hypothetical protein